MKAVKKRSWFWLMIIVFVVGFIAGVFYWTYLKTKRIANSALKAGQNAQTYLTPTPTNSAISQTTLTFPAAETEGRDLSDIPRYPDSIRSNYDESDDRITLEYFAKTAPDKIIEYYQNLITQNGWSLTAKDEGSLNFSTNRAEVMIDIIDEDKTPATQYQILYTPNFLNEVE